MGNNDFNKKIIQGFQDFYNNMPDSYLKEPEPFWYLKGMPKELALQYGSFVPPIDKDNK